MKQFHVCTDASGLHALATADHLPGLTSPMTWKFREDKTLQHLVPNTHMHSRMHARSHAHTLTHTVCVYMFVSVCVFACVCVLVLV